MPYGNFKSTLTAEQEIQIEYHLDQVDQLMGETVSLSPKQRSSFQKLGKGSIGFMQNILGFMSSNPELNSPFADRDEVKEDFEGSLRFGRIASRVRLTHEKAFDTQIALGNEALRGGRYYYSILKTVGSRIPGVDTLLAELAKSYPGRGRTKRKVSSPD